MIKRVNLGKVDGYHIGKRNCAVELEFGFREYTSQPAYFTVVANVWNNLHTDIIWGGQCVEEIGKEFKSVRLHPLYEPIKEYWKKYHLKNKSDIPIEDVHAIYKLLEEVDK